MANNTAGQVLVAEVDARKRLDAFQSVFEKTDRIMSGKDVRVAIAKSEGGLTKNAPGWTDGETIYLNGDMLTKDIQANGMGSTTVLSVKGVNYHELSHVLWTPRFSDDIVKRVIAAANNEGCDYWWFALNGLEDQRIETWFVASYSPSYRYFEALALKWLVTNQASQAEAHTLVYGRKFLPTNVRVAARQAFVAKYGADLADRFENVIDSYLRVVYPTDTNKAFTAVSEYHKLLHEMMSSGGQLPNPLTKGNAPGMGTPAAAARDDIYIRKGVCGSRDQKKARDAAETFAKQADADYKQKQQQSQQDQPAQAGSDGEGGEGEASGAPGESDAGGVVGAGSGVSKAEDGLIRSSEGMEGPRDLGEAITDLADQARDALKEVLNDPDLIEDVKETQAAIRAASHGIGDVRGDRIHGKDTALVAGQKQASTKVGHIIERLRLDLEPTWLRRQSRGRLNARRAIFRHPHQVDLFDQWDQGSEEAGGVEVAICVDLSGSMNGHVDQASQALWVLKRAFDKLGIRITVLGFSDTHMVMYDPKEKAQGGRYRLFRTYGSTNPLSALQEAAQQLLGSQQDNRILVTITDGQWGQEVQADRLVAGLRRNGVTTVLLGLNGAVRHYGPHGAEVAKDMRGIADLPDIVTDIVTNVIRKSTGRA